MSAQPGLAVRKIRSISYREVAIALVLACAEKNNARFALLGFYDDDVDFLLELADKMGVPDNAAFRRKLTRVVRRLVNFGVLYSRMSRTEKEYFGEPEKQMSYWLRPGKAALIKRERKEGVTMGPIGETEFLLRHAYPESDAAPKGGA